MRVLFLHCPPPHYMAPPRLGDEQIDCGPFFTDQQIAGRWITRTTPRGAFDVAGLAAELAASGQTPDVVVCHVDCGLCLVPRNLAVFKCPKILFAADSHWSRHGISNLVNYAASEPFDRVVLLYDRHHAAFYREAGIRNLHWFPGLTFAHSDARIQSATTSGVVRSAHLALVGKAGLHLRRRRLFASLIRARIPLGWRQLHQSEVIAHYSASLIGLNVALNGDLNLRVFETIAGGAMLLTDRLAPESGLDHLLTEGREKISYDHADDLVEKALHFLAHPEEALAIGAAGHRWFQEHFSESRRRAVFADLVFNGRDLPEFALPPPPSPRVTFGPSAALACDLINEVHRQQETVVVHADASVPADFEPFITILPRARLVRDAAIPADILLSRANGTFTAVATAAPPPALTPVQKTAAEAGHHLEAGDLQGAIEKARQALAAQPSNLDALLVMAELAADVGNRALHDKMFAAAQRADPADDRLPLLRWRLDHQPGARQPGRLITSAWRAYEAADYASAEKYTELALAADDKLAEAAYLTGLIHTRLRASAASADEQARLLRAELIAFRRAAELAPDRAEYAFALALRLRESGAPVAAIPFYENTARLDPGLIAAWFGLGEAHLELRDTAAAAAAFSEGLRHAPGHEVLRQALAIASDQSAETARAFSARFFEIQDARADCPVTALDPRWKEWIDARPGIACTRTLVGLGPKTGVPYDENIRLLLSAASATVAAGESLRHHADVPPRVSLMAYQPWFGINTLQLVAECFDQGMLLVLLDDEVASPAPAPEFSSGDFRVLTHRGISLWHVSLHRLALRLDTLPADIDSNDARHADAIRETYAQAVALIDRVVAYCDFYQPETVLMAQGHDLLSAVLRHAAVRRGLRVVALENIFRTDRLLWDDSSGIAVNRNAARNHYWRYRDFVSDEVAARSVSAFLAGIAALKSAEHRSPADRLPPLADNGMRTVVYLAQVGVDSSVLFGLRGFASQVEVIAALATHAARRGHRLLVKLHPKESPHYHDPAKCYHRLTARWLEAHTGFQAARAKLGDRLILDEENRYNTCDLIRQADVCVTVNSQAGLEAALLDREVVLCGDAFYGGLGFTHEAADAPALAFALDRILEDGLRLNEGRDARAFFHIFTDLYCLPKTVESLRMLLAGRPPFPPAPAARSETAASETLVTA